jgi:hypothetical protein
MAQVFAAIEAEIGGAAVCSDEERGVR